MENTSAFHALAGIYCTYIHSLYNHGTNGVIQTRDLLEPLKELKSVILVRSSWRRLTNEWEEFWMHHIGKFAHESGIL